MAILGLGVDIVHLPRIHSLISRRGMDRLATRILSDKERYDFANYEGDKFRFLAVRFCVKEAAYKALFPTYIPLWKELSYCKPGSSSEKPFLQFRPLREQYAFPEKIHVSVSHDGEYVLSTVIVESPQ